MICSTTAGISGAQGIGTMEPSEEAVSPKGADIWQGAQWAGSGSASKSWKLKTTATVNCLRLLLEESASKQEKVMALLPLTFTLILMLPIGGTYREARWQRRNAFVRDSESSLWSRLGRTVLARNNNS